jgi:predicted metal-binding protein
MTKLVTLNVCTSCRVAGSIYELKMMGLVLSFIKHSIINYKKQLKKQLDVKLTGCLSLFPRPCGFSFSSRGAWHYFFGDQDP